MQEFSHKNKKLVGYIKEKERRELYLTLSFMMSQGKGLSESLKEILSGFEKRDIAPKINNGPFVNNENTFKVNLIEFEKLISEGSSVDNAARICFGGISVFEEICLTYCNERNYEGFQQASKIIGE